MKKKPQTGRRHLEDMYQEKSKTKKTCVQIIQRTLNSIRQPNLKGGKTF